MIIRGITIDFELDRPADILRYDDARETYETRTKSLAENPPTEEAGLRAYATWCQGIVDAYAQMIDSAFGEGIARQLMGDSIGLTEMYMLDLELAKALEEGTQATADRLAEYIPTPDPVPEVPQNRPQRRAAAMTAKKTTKSAPKKKPAKTTAQRA